MSSSIRKVRRELPLFSSCSSLKHPSSSRNLVSFLTAGSISFRPVPRDRLPRTARCFFVKVFSCEVVEEAMA
jgi:hypothetical protein